MCGSIFNWFLVVVFSCCDLNDEVMLIARSKSWCSLVGADMRMIVLKIEHLFISVAI